jgi:hypothetical protein
VRFQPGTPCPAMQLSQKMRLHGGFSLGCRRRPPRPPCHRVSSARWHCSVATSTKFDRLSDVDACHSAGPFVRLTARGGPINKVVVLLVQPPGFEILYYLLNKKTFTTHRMLGPLSGPSTAHKVPYALQENPDS